jgi:hypothetical protein
LCSSSFSLSRSETKRTSGARQERKGRAERDKRQSEVVVLFSLSRSETRERAERDKKVFCSSSSFLFSFFSRSETRKKRSEARREGSSGARQEKGRAERDKRCLVLVFLFPLLFLLAERDERVLGSSSARLLSLSRETRLSVERSETRRRGAKREEKGRAERD